MKPSFLLIDLHPRMEIPLLKPYQANIICNTVHLYGNQVHKQQKSANPFYWNYFYSTDIIKIYVIAMQSASSRATLQYSSHSGQIAKTRQKLHSKNSWNWVVILVSATIWQVLNVKCIKTGNGNDVNQLKIALKNSWNHIKWTYFWRILPIWNHSAVAVALLFCCSLVL